MGTVRRIVGLLTVLGTLVATTGCSTSTKAGPAPSASTSAAPLTYDLARLGELTDEFPPDFIAFPFRMNKLTPQFVDQVGTVVSSGSAYTVNPQQCRPLLKSVDGHVGADTNGTRASGPDQQFIAVGADAPVTVSTAIPATGCEKMTFDVLDAPVPTHGTVERIAAPTIDGAITSALRSHADGYSDVRFQYSAILDNRVYVSVAARLVPNSDAQPLLPDLLVKAVAAIRGQFVASPKPPASPQEAALDLPRLASAQAGLPSGFVSMPPEPLKLLPQLVDDVGTVVSYGKPFDVDPTGCRPLLKPVDARAGAGTMRFRGDGPPDQSISVGAIAPVTVPKGIPSRGCDHVTFRVDDPRGPTTGTVERVAAPAIDRATTIGLKVRVDGDPYPVYSFVAILDGVAFVDVSARLAPDFSAEPTLPDLLVRAVAAVRGQ